MAIRKLLGLMALVMLAGATGCSGGTRVDLDRAGVVIGESYPVVVSSHCGIRYLSFGGLDWVPEGIVGDPGPIPGDDGLVTDTPTVEGQVVLVDAETLHFTAPRIPLMVFHPSSDPPPPCF